MSATTSSDSAKKNVPVNSASIETKKKNSMNDFYFLKAIGKGAFGEVWLVRKNETKDIYALKIMKKDLMKKKNQVFLK